MFMVDILLLFDLTELIEESQNQGLAQAAEVEAQVLKEADLVNLVKKNDQGAMSEDMERVGDLGQEKEEDPAAEKE